MHVSEHLDEKHNQIAGTNVNTSTQGESRCASACAFFFPLDSPVKCLLTSNTCLCSAAPCLKECCVLQHANQWHGLSDDLGEQTTITWTSGQGGSPETTTAQRRPELYFPKAVIGPSQGSLGDRSNGQLCACVCVYDVCGRVGGGCPNSFVSMAHSTSRL
ncbi:hypothetical protein BGZ63DRAFT_119782 [Mariannaea sp. PMI_226]|nr:hypothetical protein BGZ63DRAFT_119782 [Mariannaea sp. PMI_226]